MFNISSIRDRQISASVKIIGALAKFRSGRMAIEGMSRYRTTKAAMDRILGYRHTFDTLDEAECAVKSFSRGGHENLQYAMYHLKINEHPRPSDYAALFYLLLNIDNIKTVFDLGGNVGNLYYCYNECINFAEGLQWKIYDLDANITLGRKIALDRMATKLSFTSNWLDASGSDLVIASGSMHYFDTPLPYMIGQLSSLPKTILINRTPLTDGPTFSIIQDAGHSRVACKIYNKNEIVDGFCKEGYTLTNEWDAAEHHLNVIDRPSRAINSYSGLLFERTAKR